MNELKDERLLTGIRIHDADDAANSGLDLNLLADQLAMIAGELRRAEARQNAGTKASSRAHHSNGNSRSSASTSGAPMAERIDFARAAAAQTMEQLGGRLGFADPQERRSANAETARQVYDRRRRRTVLFGNSELFGEPAWDILLDLYIAHAENKPVSVSSACIGSAAPPTTGLRWLGVLAEHELILREHDPEDQRRVLVRLTDRGIAAMDKYFSGVGPVS